MCGMEGRAVGATGTVSASAGTRMTNSLPRFAPSLMAWTVPPCSSTRRRTSVRPIPRPPWERSSERSTWVNRSKTRGEHLGGDADPVVADPEDGLVARPASTSRSILPPSSVYLAALFSRLESTWASRTRSAFTGNRLRRAGRRSARACGHRSAGGWSRRRGRRSTAASTGSLRSWILPPRDPRDVEQVVDQADQLLDLAADDVAGPLEVGVLESRARRISTALRIGARGLRSSWASIARNSFLRRSFSWMSR